MQPLPLGPFWSTPGNVSSLPQDLDLHWQKLLEFCPLCARESHSWESVSLLDFTTRPPKEDVRGISWPLNSVGYPVLQNCNVWVAWGSLEAWATGTQAHQRKEALKKLPVLQEPSTGEALDTVGFKIWIRHLLCRRLLLEKPNAMQSWALEKSVCWGEHTGTR